MALPTASPRIRSILLWTSPPNGKTTAIPAAQCIRELMSNYGWKYKQSRINKKWVLASRNSCRPTNQSLSSVMAIHDICHMIHCR